MKRKWDVSSKEARAKCVAEIITLVDEQSDTHIGVMTTEDIIDVVIQNLGPDIYNSAIKDVKKLLQARFSDIDTDIDLLEQQG